MLPYVPNTFQLTPKSDLAWCFAYLSTCVSDLQISKFLGRAAEIGYEQSYPIWLEMQTDLMIFCALKILDVSKVLSRRCQGGKKFNAFPGEMSDALHE